MLKLLHQKSVALLFLLFCSVSGIATVSAQGSHFQVQQSSSLTEALNTDQKSPKTAFLRSLVFPGWGHLYAGSQHFSRGALHVGADAALIGSIFGFNIRANRIENDFITYANLYAGINLDSRDRSFRLAVGDFNSLDDYNDYQLRTRNWNRLIDDTPDNRWNWPDSESRFKYRDMRSDADRIRSQIPALAGIMVVNRIISAISAYNRVQNDLENSRTNRAELTVVPVLRRQSNEHYVAEISGAAARIRVQF